MNTNHDALLEELHDLQDALADRAAAAIREQAKEITRLKDELILYKPLPGGVPLQQFIVEQERDALRQRVEELERQ